MDPIIAEELATRLESGKYPQGTCALRKDNDEFCCLGVLSEMAVEAGVIPPPILNVIGVYQYGDETGYETGVLHRVIMEWAGMKTVVGKYIDEDGYTHLLTEKNDAGDSFPEIAKIIRENVTRL